MYICQHKFFLFLLFLLRGTVYFKFFLSDKKRVPDKAKIVRIRKIAFKILVLPQRTTGFAV